MAVRFSIIIPVYNAAAYLRCCIDSVLSQSFQDLELLLIDDGSTDDSGGICDEYAKADNRVKVHHTMNGGASRARNIGLALASGEYVWFVDADDWIDSDSLTMLSYDLNVDLVFFGFKKIYNNYMSICKIQSEKCKYSENLVSIAQELFNSPNLYFGFTWNKLFKRCIIEDSNIRFNEDLIIKEDEVFTFEYLRNVQSLMISSLTPYNYRMLESSLSHDMKAKRNMLQLANYMRDNILADEFFHPMRQSISTAVCSYYMQAVIENVNKPEYEEAKEAYLSFLKDNKKFIALRGKQKILSMVPTDIIKEFFIKFYVRLSSCRQS